MIGQAKADLEHARAEAEKRAKRIISTEDYSLDKIYRVLPAGPEWEVLFTGRYTGNTRAGILGDPTGVKLPYRCWVREDGTGFVTEGW